MDRVYADACESGKNFNDVPDVIAEKVRAIIESDGYYIDENGIVRKTS